ncbi:MAG: TauD/TfdA family dioxygenase [Actinomycetota bacterium]
MAASFNIDRIAPTVGAEISGLSAEMLDDDNVIAEVHAAFVEHHVLVFRDLALDRESHKALGRRFGELHVHPSRRAPDFPGDREIFSVRADENTTLNNGGLWHADVTCDEIPPLGSLLRLTEQPGHGGDTLFANMHAAFESLSTPMQTFLETLTALHDQQLDVERYRIAMPDDHAWVRNVHPVVVRHPVTGRKLLYVNRAFTRSIVELNPAESRALLDLLCDHIADTHRFQCRVRWEPDTLVLWDNRCVQHYAVWDYFPQRRVGERVTIAATSRPA